MASTSKIRQFEGSVRIKGYKIAYVLWLPSIEQEQQASRRDKSNSANNSSSSSSSSNTTSNGNSTSSTSTSTSSTTTNVIKYMNNIDPIALSSHYKHTMLCLHGWLDNAMSFSKIAPLLCSKYNNLRIIAIDWPGHGKSSHSPVGYYDRSMFGTTIIRFLHRIDCHSNIHLMGHSMGAIYLPYIVPLLSQNGNNIYGNRRGDSGNSMNNDDNDDDDDNNNSNVNYHSSNNINSKWFDIKSLVCLEQFGAARSNVELSNSNLANLQYLVPASMAEEEELDADDSSNNNNNKKDSSGGDNRVLPKLYDTIDEIVKSRVWVTKEIYPGNQWIDEESARIILRRNIGSVTVVETNDRKFSNNNNTNNKKRKKVKKYFLRTDIAWRNAAIDPIGRIWGVNLRGLYETIIPKIECPIVALFVENGWPLLDSVAVYCKDKLKLNNLTIERVAGSHHVHIDNPLIVMNKLEIFFDKIIGKNGKNNDYYDDNDDNNEEGDEMDDVVPSAASLRINNTKAKGEKNNGNSIYGNMNLVDNHSTVLLQSKL